MRAPRGATTRGPRWNETHERGAGPLRRRAGPRRPAPASRWSTAAGTQTRPSARTTFESVAEPPRSGSAHSSPSRSSRRDAQVVLAPDGRAVARRPGGRARRAGQGSRPISPPRRQSIGRTKASNTTSDEVGKPGMPDHRLGAGAREQRRLARADVDAVEQDARRRQIAERRRPERSFVPTDEPPERITASCSGSRRATAARRASASSRDDAARASPSQPAASICGAPARTGWRRAPARARRLRSGAHSSLPVDSTATRGRRKTVDLGRRRRWPARARSCGPQPPPAPAGRRRRGRRSSPGWTTLAPAATARDDLDARAAAAAVAAAAERPRVLDHHHGVGARGQKAAGGDRHRLARGHPRRGRRRPSAPTPTTLSTTRATARRRRATSAARTA